MPLHFHAISTLEKPLKHLTLKQWNTQVNQIRDVADARRNDAFDMRHNSRTLRNETRIDGNWANYATNEALTDRITELNRWRQAITGTYERIEKEMHLLSEEKASTERELEALQTPISVIAECLSVRDSRLGAEITYDTADTEIKKELAVVEDNQRLLSQQCNNAWVKLSRLEDVKFNLGLELENKAEAVHLDMGQLDLDKFAANITYKTNATRNPKNSCSYKSWLDHTKKVKQMADAELADTYSIRESLFVCREKARNRLLCQQDRAEHAVRRRIFETQRARNELEYQKMKMRDEMSKNMGEIKILEETLREKTDALKLAETRLENRAQRSGKELCLDQAHSKLVAEVVKLREIRCRISCKIDQAKAHYNLLDAHEQKINQDLENKQHSLMTDIRALDLRQRLKGGEFGNTTTSGSVTDRGIVLTKMESEIPKI